MFIINGWQWWVKIGLGPLIASKLVLHSMEKVVFWVNYEILVLIIEFLLISTSWS